MSITLNKVAKKCTKQQCQFTYIHNNEPLFFLLKGNFYNVTLVFELFHIFNHFAFSPFYQKIN